MYSQEGFIAPEYGNSISEIIPEKNYEFSDPRMLLFQNENGSKLKVVKLKELLDTFYDFKNDEFKKTFLNACVIFEKSQELLEFDKSVSYIFLVSSIECLIDIEFKGVKYEPCKTCETTQYQVMKKFRDFIDKYGFEVNKKTKNDFYKLRSNISHSGRLFESSYFQNFFIETQDDFDKKQKSYIEDIKYRDLLNLTRTCFRTFILFNMRNDKTMPNTS